MIESRPVVLIGIDAAEIRVIDRLLDEGRLPNLAVLRDRGRHGRLFTQPGGFLSMVWPTFYNATRIGTHGFYFNKLWRHDRQRLEFPKPSWLPQQPAWDDLATAGLRMALLDIPAMMGPPPGLDGIYLSGWQTHDDFGRREHPAGLRRDLEARFGPPKMRAEFFGVQDGNSLLRQRQEALESLDQMGAIAAHLLSRDRFDLFAVVLGGAHRGGHYLWDLSQIDAHSLTAEDRRTLEGANDDLYVAADAAVGRIMAAAPDDARILVFAVHGMARNDGWSEYFPRLLARIRGDDAAPSKSGLLYRVKQALPWKAVRQVTTRLPVSVNQWLVQVWSARMLDWGTTRFFPLPVDLNGYVRFNLEGREPQGIVGQGPEYEALCAELCEAFESFVDIETGRPVVTRVDRTDDLVGADAARRQVLPDLIVNWGEVAATESSGVHAPRYGDVRWEKGARLFSGRSGNHIGDGWFIATGDGIAVGHDRSVPDGCDLLPTVFSWLGQPLPERFEGTPIPGLLGSDAQPPGSERAAAVDA